MIKSHWTGKEGYQTVDYFPVFNNEENFKKAVYTLPNIWRDATYCFW